MYVVYTFCDGVVLFMVFDASSSLLTHMCVRTHARTCTEHYNGF